jgi:nucleolar complex protein 3
MTTLICGIAAERLHTTAVLCKSALRICCAVVKLPFDCCRVAVKCLGELLIGVPHFNCIHDVLESLIHSACGKDARCRTYACSALATLLRDTQHTDVMVDAVQMAADAVRKAKCVCPPDIAYALMAVKFKELSRDDVDKGELAF